MVETVNRLLLAGDKFDPEMHVIQPEFTYSGCRAFKKYKERIQQFKQTRESRCIYQKEVDEACFQHDMALWISLEEQILMKYCVIKHLILLNLQNTMEINVDLLQWFCLHGQRH